jgi:hypothetical protein
MPPVAICPDELSTAALSRAFGPRMEQLIVYAVVDLRASHDEPLGHSVETFVRREDAERFIEEVGGDDPEVASYLRIEGLS